MKKARPWLVGLVGVIAWFAYFETEAFVHPDQYDTLSHVVSTIGAKWPLAIFICGQFCGVLSAHFFGLGKPTQWAKVEVNMDSEILKPLLASLARHGLTAAGAYLGLTGADSTQFVGAGMVLAGLAWAWWQKSGQDKFIAALAKMNPVASKDATTGEAVKAAKEAVNAAK